MAVLGRKPRLHSKWHDVFRAHQNPRDQVTARNGMWSCHRPGETSYGSHSLGVKPPRFTLKGSFRMQWKMQNERPPDIDKPGGPEGAL